MCVTPQYCEKGYRCWRSPMPQRLFGDRRGRLTPRNTLDTPRNTLDTPRNTLDTPRNTLARDPRLKGSGDIGSRHLTVRIERSSTQIAATVSV
jgi:hypothetical protein